MRRINLKKWGGFAAGCVLLLTFDQLQQLTAATLEAGAVYQRIVTGFRPQVPHHTAVVLIREDVEPSSVGGTNVCEQREFLSRILTVIGSAKPPAIVINKHFAPDTCRTFPAGTDALRKTIGELLDSGIRVVVGRRSDEDGNVKPTVSFTGNRGARVLEGDTTFDQDVRRVRFEWRDARFPDGSVGTVPTLSFQGAKAKAPDLLEENDRVARIAARGQAPFIAFIPPAAMERYTFSALHLLCGASAPIDADWRHCSQPEQEWVAKLGDRVVIVGENTGPSASYTAVGTVGGSALVANYVEAIIAGDLYAPLPPVVALIVNFAFFAVVQWVIRTQRTQFKAPIVIAIVAGAYVVSWSMTNLFGLFFDPAIGLSAAVIGWVSDQAASHFVDTEEPKAAEVA